MWPTELYLLPGFVLTWATRHAPHMDQDLLILLETCPDHKVLFCKTGMHYVAITSTYFNSPVHSEGDQGCTEILRMWRNIAFYLCFIYHHLGDDICSFQLQKKQSFAQTSVNQCFANFNGRIAEMPSYICATILACIRKMGRIKSLICA